MTQSNSNTPTLADVLTRISELTQATQKQGEQISAEVTKLDGISEALTTQVGSFTIGLTEIKDSLTEIQNDSRLTLLLALLTIIVALAAYIGEVRRRILDEVKKELDREKRNELKHQVVFLLFPDI